MGSNGEVSDRISASKGTTTYNSSDGSSSIFSGGYYQDLPSGDRIHSSSPFSSSRAISSLLDGIADDLSLIHI